MSKLTRLGTEAGRPPRWLVLFMIFTAIHPVQANPAGGTVHGHVIGLPGNQPLDGAHVVIRPGGKVTFTDNRGAYRITGLPPGKYDITVSYVGYSTSKKDIRIGEGEDKTVDFILEASAIETPEVEITEERSDRRPQDKPLRMEVIPAQAISNNPGLSIVSSLDFVSGVNLSSTMGIFANNTVVTLRGMSGNDQARTLVLLDDIPLNKSDAGSVNWNLINRDNVEKIEIMKGPGAARYGSSAMGGVISIRTKQPSSLVSGSATIDYGTFNTAGFRYQLTGKINPKDPGKGFIYGMNGFYRRSDGYNPEIPQYLEKSDTFYVNTYLREASIGAKAGYRFNPRHLVEAGVNFFNDKRGRGMEIYEVDGAFEEHDTWQANIRYKGGAGPVRWTLTAYNQDEHFERLNEYMKEGEYNLYLVRSNRIDRGAGLDLALAAGRSHALSAGLDYQHGAVDGQDIYYTSTDLITNRGKMETWAFYLQDEIGPAGKKFQLSLGLRLNYALFHDGSFLVEDPSYSIDYLVNYQDSLFPKNSWFQADPKLSFQYRFTPESRVYFSAAQGFRAPNLDDLCRTGKMKNGFKIANPSLGPEMLDNLELGADVMFFRKLHAAVSLFYSIGRDFMYYVSTGDSVNMGYKLTPVFMKENISKVEITGLEVDLSLDPWRWLSLFANYTFNHSVIRSFTPRDTAVDRDLNGKYLTDVPLHKASAGFTVTNKILNINFLWKYTGKRYINDLNEMDPYLLTDQYPSYQTFGLRFWHTFFKHLTTALNIDNIFDATYIDDQLRQSPGRMITAEIVVFL